MYFNLIHLIQHYLTSKLSLSLIGGAAHPCGLHLYVLFVLCLTYVLLLVELCLAGCQTTPTQINGKTSICLNVS